MAASDTGKRIADYACRTPERRMFARDAPQGT
jgi:hypothetical protein